MPIKVKEIMSSPAYTIDANETIQTAAVKMTENRRGFLIVVQDDNIVGVISDSDILRTVVSQDRKPSEIKVKEVMSAPVVTIDANEDIVEAVKKMKMYKIKRLPVIEEGKVVGVISLSDIAMSSPEMIEVLELRLKMKEEPLPVIQEGYTVGICESCGNYSEKLVYKNGSWVCENCAEEEE